MKELVNRFQNVENYDKKVIQRGFPVTRFLDKEGRLHRIDGPAFSTSHDNKFFLHGVEFGNKLLFIEELERLDLINILNKIGL